MTDIIRPPNRRQAAAEARRQAVLDAALEEFAERGYAGARLDDVAARAGVAKGTIYLVCKDKQDLFQQVVLGAMTPVLERSGLARTFGLGAANCSPRCSNSSKPKSSARTGSSSCSSS